MTKLSVTKLCMCERVLCDKGVCVCDKVVRDKDDV